jgi:hypothetical protein
MSAQGAAPGGGSPGGGSINGRAEILPFCPRRSPAPRACAVCLYPLRCNAPSWWKLCWECFRHVQLARAIGIYRGDGRR